MYIKEERKLPNIRNVPRNDGFQEYAISREVDARILFECIVHALFSERAGPVINVLVEQGFLHDLLSDLAMTAPEGRLTKEQGVYTLKIFGYQFRIGVMTTDKFGPVVLLEHPFIKFKYDV